MKRLDLKICDLQNEGAMPADPSLPSLVQESTGNLVPPVTSTSTGASGVSTPLNPLSGNASGGSSSIAHAAVARMTSSTFAGRTTSPSTAGLQPHALLQQSQIANSPSLASISMQQRQRETSVSSETKRRRLNSSLGGGGGPHTLSSGLGRQSSLGPGTSNTYPYVEAGTNLSWREGF